MLIRYSFFHFVINVHFYSRLNLLFSGAGSENFAEQAQHGQGIGNGYEAEADLHNYNKPRSVIYGGHIPVTDCRKCSYAEVQEGDQLAEQILAYPLALEGGLAKQLIYGCIYDCKKIMQVNAAMLIRTSVCCSLTSLLLESLIS